MQLVLKSRIELVFLLEKAANALDKHVGRGGVPVNGKRSTGRALAALLRGHARAHNEAARLHKSWLLATRKLRQQLRAEIIPAMFSVRAFATGAFGSHSATFYEFGFRPPKKRGRKIKTIASGVEKAAATRKARGTMGKKQRRAIKAVGGAPEAAPR